jgi:hypothetical protein
VPLSFLYAAKVFLLSLQCDIGGEVECEFPCFNQLSREEEAWGPDPSFTGGHFGGVLLQTAAAQPSQLFGVMFPRVQIQLRRNTLRRYNVKKILNFYHTCKY